MITALQKGAVIYPIPICRMFVAMKEWGLSDALGTFWLTFAASVKMNGPSSWTMSSLFHTPKISLMSLQMLRVGPMT